jgi:hypothetical protein
MNLAFPKIELHLHLDCCLSYEVVRRLAPGSHPRRLAAIPGRHCAVRVNRSYGPNPGLHVQYFGEGGRVR